MLFKEKPNHTFVTIFGEGRGEFERLLKTTIVDRDLRLISPENEEILMEAAENSSVVFIIIDGLEDANLRLATAFQAERMIVAEVIALSKNSLHENRMDILARGFDGYLSIAEMETMGFKKYFSSRITKGSNRLDSLINEEEYRRFADALSIVPGSLVVLDQDKRIVFISDHYLRAYPKSSARLTRGLKVYDLFEIIMNEEKLDIDKSETQDLREFWYNLTGNITYTTRTGNTHRLHASNLPNGRGVVVSGENITDHVRKEQALADRLKSLQDLHA